MSRSGPAEYTRALDLIVVASQHARNGHLDTARTGLHSAYRDGKLDRPERLAGYLQYRAATALVNVLDQRVQSATDELKAVLREARRLRPRDRSVVIERCEQVMDLLPYMRELDDFLHKAAKACDADKYVDAYELLREAGKLCKKHRQFLSRATIERMANARRAAMLHLLSNHQTDTQFVMSVMAELRRKRLLNGDE